MKWRAWAALAWAGTCTSWTFGGTYTYTRIGSTLDGFVDLHPPSISRDGHVAFFEWARGMQKIRVGTGGTTTIVADTSGPIANFDTKVRCGNGGLAAFRAFLDAGGSAVYSGTGGPLTTIVATGPVYASIFTAPPINGSGVAAIRAFLVAGGGGVFRGSGGPIDTIATTATYPQFAGGTGISDNGAVAFFTSQAGVWTLRVSDGTTTTPLIDSSGDLQTPSGLGGPGSVGLADDNVAVSFWTLDAGGSGIFIVDDGIVTPIATTAGAFSSFEDPIEGTHPAMNNKHQIAYWAKLDDSGSGMFTGPDIVKDKVIRTGDALDGSIVVNTRHGKGISDTGQVCFLATLASGAVGVYRADPVPACVPADLNCDGHVNGLDLATLLAAWTG